MSSGRAAPLASSRSSFQVKLLTAMTMTKVTVQPIPLHTPSPSELPLRCSMTLAMVVPN